MRLLPEAWRAGLVMVLLGAMAGPSLQAAQPATPLPAEEANFRLQDVEQALESLRADPDLGAERKIRALRWITEDTPEPQREAAGWRRWVMTFFSWLAGSARLLVWVACALLAALVLIFLFRLLREHRGERGPASAAAPTHVRDLDIRPESLPEDIGAAARRLWDEGESRRALALLYRGLLSKLAHDHLAPVRESTTEGDSIALARRFLPAAGGNFATELVQTWSLAVYGERLPASAQVHALCGGFAPALQSPAREAMGAA